MELTGGADCGALEGDKKSERVEEEVACGGSVEVDLPTRPSRALHDKMAASSAEEDVVGDFHAPFYDSNHIDFRLAIRHNDGLGIASPGIEFLE